MASLLDILGQSRNNSLAPAGGYDPGAPGLLSGRPAVAQAAPSVAPGATSRNPFNSMFASDAGGLRGLIGQLSGAPTQAEMVNARMGQGQATGLQNLQSHIDAAGGNTQKGVMDFISTPEGQQFFTTSQDPIGAIKGYLQLSQKPAAKFGTLSPGQAVYNEGTGVIGATQPTTEQQNMGSVSQLAKFTPEETQNFYKNMAGKMSSDPNNLTQKEDAIKGLKEAGLIDDIFAKKWLAGLIQITPQLDANGQKIGLIATDISKYAQTQNINDIQSVIIGGANTGGPNANQPAGTTVNPDTAKPNPVSGDIIFGAGVVGNAAEKLGGITEQIAPGLTGKQYVDYKTQLTLIKAKVTDLMNTNRAMSGEFKLYNDAVDNSGWAQGPIAQAQALITLTDALDRTEAYDNMVMGSTDPKIATNKNREQASTELAQIGALRAYLPPREELIRASVEAQGGRGSLKRGIEEGVKNLDTVIKGVTDTAKTAVGAGETAAGAAEKAVGGQGTSEGVGTPQTFKNEQDAAAAANAGTLKPGADGKIHVMIDGVERTFSQSGGK